MLIGSISILVNPSTVPFLCPTCLVAWIYCTWLSSIVRDLGDEIHGQISRNHFKQYSKDGLGHDVAKAMKDD